MDPKKLRAQLEKIRKQELLLYQNEQAIQYLKQSYKKTPEKKTLTPPSMPASKMPIAPEEPRYWGETPPGSTRKERKASRKMYLFEENDPLLWGKKRRNRLCFETVSTFLFVTPIYTGNFFSSEHWHIALSIASLIALFFSFITYMCLSRDFPKHNNRIMAEYAANLDAYKTQMAAYEAAMEDYNRKYAEYEAMLETNDHQHERACLLVRQFNAYLDEQIQSHTQKHTLLWDQLRKLYKESPIHPNYQGLIPVTRFCEYLDIGLRTTLHGEKGMYDLYEEELRFQRITDQLDVVNENLRSINVGLAFLGSQLTGIQRNQTMLYREVAAANHETKKFRADTERMWKQLEAQNTYLTEIAASSKSAARFAAETAKETKRIADADELRRHRALLEE